MIRAVSFGELLFERRDRITNEQMRDVPSDQFVYAGGHHLLVVVHVVSERDVVVSEE